MGGCGGTGEPGRFPLALSSLLFPLSPRAFTRVPPAAVERHMQTEENTLGNQDVPDKLPQVRAEVWALDGAVGSRTNKRRGQEGRMRAPFHIPALTTALRLNFGTTPPPRLPGRQPRSTMRNQMKVQNYGGIPKAAEGTHRAALPRVCGRR